MTAINSFDAKTSIALVKLVRDSTKDLQRPGPQTRPQRFSENNSVAKSPVGGIPGRVGNEPGFALCDMYFFDAEEELQARKLNDGRTVQRNVYNLSSNPIAQGEWIIASPVGVDLFCNQDELDIPKFKFLALADISERTVNVVILESQTRFLRRGGVLNVYDPSNLWGTLTRGCIGFAGYNDQLEKWEIETSSLPANEVVVTITDRLRSTGSPPVGTVIADWGLRSTYPNVLRPPLPSCETTCEYTWHSWGGNGAGSWTMTTPCGATCNCSGPPTKPPDDPDAQGPLTAPGVCIGDGDIEIEFENPLKLDAICNSKVYLRRVSNAGFGESLERAPFATGSATAFRWEVVAVEKKHARWITFTYLGSDGAVTIDSFCDGEDPTPCGAVTVEYPHGVPCPDDLVTAYYCPSSNVYKAIVTNAAMLGAPIVRNMVLNVDASQCGITLKKIPVRLFRAPNCLSVPVDSEVSLGTSIPVVIGVGSTDCGAINYSYQYIRAFLCDDYGDPTTPQYASSPINLGGALFLTGASFGGDACAGQATWTLTGGVWVLTTPCTEGCATTPPASVPSGTNDGETTSTSCEPTPGRNCGLNLRYATLAQICNNSSYPPAGTTVHVPLALQPIDVVQNVFLGSSAIVVSKAIAYVCEWNTIADSYIPLTACEPVGSGGSGGSG